MEKRDYDIRIQTACLAILTIVTIAGTLYLLRAVLVPFILAVCLTLILLPIVDILMRKLKIGRPIALFTTLFMGFLVLYGVGTLVVSSVNQFSENSSVYESRLIELVAKAENVASMSGMRTLVGGTKDDDATEEPDKDAAAPDRSDSGEASVIPPESDGELAEDGTTIDSEVPEHEAAKKVGSLDSSMLLSSGVIQGYVKQLPVAVMSVVSNVFLVMLFTAFLLAGSTTRLKPRQGVIGEIEARVQKYIGIKIILSITTGALVYMVLRLLDVDYALSFGAFAFILNFVPNVGSIIATALPVPIILLDPDVNAMLIVLGIGLPAIIQTIIGNVIEPKIMGDTLGLHPIVILMALIFWGMLWGFTGMLLAVPMTAITKIIFERIEVTRPIAGLMEGRLETLDEM